MKELGEFIQDMKDLKEFIKEATLEDRDFTQAVLNLLVEFKSKQESQTNIQDEYEEAIETLNSINNLIIQHITNQIEIINKQFKDEY